MYKTNFPINTDFLKNRKPHIESHKYISFLQWTLLFNSVIKFCKLFFSSNNKTHDIKIPNKFQTQKLNINVNAINDLFGFI